MFFQPKRKTGTTELMPEYFPQAYQGSYNLVGKPSQHRVFENCPVLYGTRDMLAVMSEFFRLPASYIKYQTVHTGKAGDVGDASCVSRRQ